MTEPDRERAEVARQYAAYLRDQTGVEVAAPEPGDVALLRAHFELLDLALGQIADLASIYGSDQRGDIEPLAVPTAMLAGEYLRAGIGARWMEPAFPGDISLLLLTPDGVALDLEGMARAALLSPRPNLTALVERLLEASPGPETE